MQVFMEHSDQLRQKFRWMVDCKDFAKDFLDKLKVNLKCPKVQQKTLTCMVAALEDFGMSVSQFSSDLFTKKEAPRTTSRARRQGEA